MSRCLALLPFALVLAACHAAPPGTACNGHDELCARAYDQVAFPGTHDADSTVADNFAAPDQTNSMAQQLADGVRVLHLEIFAYDDDVYLCHGVCVIGSQLFVDGLREVAGFVGKHPRDVVTLLMESTDVTRDAIMQALDKSGLGSRLHEQSSGVPWPTLGELIDKGDRVVAFLDDTTGTGGGSYAAILDRFSWTWETPWDNETAADFARCDVDRGTQGNDLYVVDTYLEDQALPTAAQAQLVNANPFLLDRLLHCHATTGQLPNFVMVNYYEVGDLFADVDILNGLASPPSGNVDAFPQPFDAGTD
jgi:hypothetical protein